MGKISSRNSALEKRINELKIELFPYHQLPNGTIHPAFPRNFISYTLLTEDELDSLAHFYHQSTPGPYTQSYPATMTWDKDFLARTPVGTNQTFASITETNDSDEELWLTDIMNSIKPLGSTSTPTTTTPAPERFTRLSKKDRVRIKRRKFGKFIGLGGMKTPTEEIFFRIQSSLDRAVDRSRAELKRNEDAMMGRRKLA